MAVIELVEPMLEQVVAEATGATKRAAKENAEKAEKAAEETAAATVVEDAAVEESTVACQAARKPSAACDERPGERGGRCGVPWCSARDQ
jgi:large subunit ribosomal protein L17